MKIENNGFNILKVNGSTLIIGNMWKNSLIHSNINVGSLNCYMCFNKLW
jgi:hypothetical protein